MKNFVRLLIVLIAVLLTTSCTTLNEMRNVHERVVLAPGEVPQSLSCMGRYVPTDGPGLPNSIEDYGRYIVGYAEFDDQGWNAGAPDVGGQVDTIMRTLGD